jgi:glycosyltransferase involved in cell wall biosynthesis
VKISACIITFNEEKNIAEAIKSVGWADEILVIDSGSTDKTTEIAESFGAKVISQDWLGFSLQKQFAVNNATYDWIFSLDADEVVSENLRAEILSFKLLKENALADGYKIPRLSFYMNRPIKHGGWYPDWQIRFFNRNKAEWKNALVHESVEVSGEIRKLSGDILHYSIENAAYHHRLIGERYAPLAAEQMYKNGRKTSKLKIATVGFTTFFKTYFLNLGFLDGFPGFCIARFAAHHSFLKHLLLWELQHSKK